MNYKGLIVTNAFTLWKETGAMIQRFRDEFQPYGISVDHLTNDHVLALIDENGRAEATVSGYDFIIYLDKDYYIAKLLEKCGFRLFNPADAIHICDDKMLTHLCLANEGIKMPKTINYPLRFGPGESDVFYRRVIAEIGFPMIVKHCFGSLGEQVFLIKTETELRALEAEISYIPHLFQEFVSSSFGTDLRIAVVAGRAVANMKREAQNPQEFRSNIETGGIGHMIPFPESFRKMAETVARVLHLDYCGLDILYGPQGEPILCEVNSNAYFGPIEKYSGVNVAAIYAHHIYDEIYQNRKKSTVQR